MPPGLELEQGMGAVALGDRLHRAAERRGRDPGPVLKGRERVHQRRRQHAAEVGDHRPDRGAHALSTSRIPAPALPDARSASAAEVRRTPPCSVGGGRRRRRRRSAAAARRRRGRARAPTRPGSPSASVLGREQGLRRAGRTPVESPSSAGDHLLAVPAGAGRAHGRDRDQAAVVEPRRDDPQRSTSSQSSSPPSRQTGVSPARRGRARRAPRWSTRSAAARRRGR